MANRALRVSITIMPNGHHRLHVYGDVREVSELVRVSRGLLEMYDFNRASGPESRWQDIRAAWVQSGSRVASKALFSLRHEARPVHLREHPDCPHRDIGEGRPNLKASQA